MIKVEVNSIIDIVSFSQTIAMCIYLFVNSLVKQWYFLGVVCLHGIYLVMIRKQTDAKILLQYRECLCVSMIYAWCILNEARIIGWWIAGTCSYVLFGGIYWVLSLRSSSSSSQESIQIPQTEIEISTPTPTNKFPSIDDDIEFE